MKNIKVLSVSLGSSSRDATAQLTLGDALVQVRRLGTDGDIDKARSLFAEYDGKVDAFGLGGTDLYLYAGKRRYVYAQSRRLIAGAKHTPVLDGSGIKNSWEPYLIAKLQREGTLDFRGKRVLHMCGVDRFAMGRAMAEAGAEVTFGDLVYGVGVNYPIHSLAQLGFLAGLVVPIITKCPISWFYPTGSGQTERISRHPEYFAQNDIIAGDFHFIRRFMPDELSGKTIITNTVTASDRELLRSAGISCLLTVTPDFQGRSFGTNVLEALLTALAGSKEPLSFEQYKKMLVQYAISAKLNYFDKKESV